MKTITKFRVAQRAEERQTRICNCLYSVVEVAIEQYLAAKAGVPGSESLMITRASYEVALTRWLQAQKVLSPMIDRRIELAKRLRAEDDYLQYIAYLRRNGQPDKARVA